MNECGDTIDEYSTIDGHITHYCEKPKGHEKNPGERALCSCPCLYRWEKIGK